MGPTAFDGREIINAVTTNDSHLVGRTGSQSNVA